MKTRRILPWLGFAVGVILLAVWVYHRWDGPPENPLNLTKGETVVFGVVALFWFVGCFAGFAYCLERYLDSNDVSK